MRGGGGGGEEEEVCNGIWIRLEGIDRVGPAVDTSSLVTPYEAKTAAVYGRELGFICKNKEFVASSPGPRDSEFSPQPKSVFKTRCQKLPATNAGEVATCGCAQNASMF